MLQFNCQVLEPQDPMKPSASCAQPQKGNGGSSTRAQQTEGFCVFGRCGTTVQRYQGSNRHMEFDGFWRNQIARGYLSRQVKGFELERLLIDSSDAPMPWLREALKLANSNRVGLPSPSTVHPEAFT